MVKPTTIPDALVMPGNILRLKRVKLGDEATELTTVVSARTSVVTGANGEKEPLFSLVQEYPEFILGKKLAAQTKLDQLNELKAALGH